MKPKQVFDWKFRNGQAALVAMVLALLFATSARAEWTSLQCKLYSQLSESARLWYVSGLADGYAMAAQKLSAMASMERPKDKDKDTWQFMQCLLGADAAALASDLKGVAKLTHGALQAMLDAECHNAPDADVTLAFFEVMRRMQ